MCISGVSFAYEMVNSKRYEFKLFENFVLTRTLFTQEQAFVGFLLNLKSTLENEINLIKTLLASTEENMFKKQEQIINASTKIIILKEQVL